MWTLLEGLLHDHLDARDGALDGVPRDSADIAADFGRTLDEGTSADADGVDRLDADLLRALEHADHASLGGGTDVAADLGRALDGGHQCPADGVDGSVQDLTGALDRADHLVFHRLHDPLAAWIHLAHAGPPSGGRTLVTLGDGPTHPRGCPIQKTLHPLSPEENLTCRAAP